jgi:hypothetical protein
MRRSSLIAIAMKEPPRWPMWVRAGLAFVIVVASLVFVWLLVVYLNAPPSGFD